MAIRQASRARDWALLAGLALFFLSLDRLTKWLVVENLAVGEAWAPLPFLAKVFTITHVQNTGVSFGQLAGLGWVFMAVNLVVLVAVLAYYGRIPQGNTLIRIACGLIVAGDLGNLIDRLYSAYRQWEASTNLLAALSRAYVTDFLDFKVWPVFNVADLWVVTGVIIVGWTLWRSERIQARERVADKPEARP